MLFSSLGMLWLVAPFVLGVLWLNERSNRKIEARKYYDQGYADGYIAATTSPAHPPQPAVSAAASVVSEATAAQQPAAADIDTLPSDGDTDEQYVAEDQPAQSETSAFNWSADSPAPTTAHTRVTIDPAKRKLQNLNTLLYMASFLLVAAAAAFIAAAMPAGVRFGVLVIVVTLFYVGGLVLYKMSERLRPAAMAFVGTGLAILPFIGVAMTMLIDVPASTAWLSISLIGLVAYVYAAVILQNQVVSYLSLAFVLSTVSSAVSVASLPIVWHFIGLIAVALLASTISYIQPKLLPRVFRKPLETTGQIVTPIALIASLVVAEKMSIRMYEIVFGLASAQYLLTWLQRRSYRYETICRVLVHGTALIVAWDIAQMSYETKNMLLFGILWIMYASIQGSISLVRASAKANAAQQQAEVVWIVVMHSMLSMAILYWFANFNQPDSATLSVVALIVGAMLAAATTWRFRDMTWAYVGLVNIWLVVLAVCRWLIMPTLPWEIIMVIYLSLAIGSLGLYWRYRETRQSIAEFVTTSMVLFGIGVLLSGLLSGEIMTIGWAAVCIGVLAVVYSHLSRTASTEMLGAGFGVAAIWLWVSQASMIDAAWRSTVAIVVALVLLVAAAAVYHFSRVWVRRNGLICIGIGVSMLLIVNVVNSDEIVRQTSTALLLLCSIATFSLRWRAREKTDLQQLFTVGYFVQILFAWWFTFTVPMVWDVACYAVATVLFFAASYVEKTRGLMVGGLILIPVTLYTGWQWLTLPSEWLVVGVATMSLAVIYALHWVFVRAKDAWREQVSIAGVWLIALLVFLVKFTAVDSAQVIAGCLLLLAGAVTMGVYAYCKKDRLLAEIAVYGASVAVQKMVHVLVPEANYVFYAHWWAATILLVAWWRKRTGQSTEYRPMLAVGIVSASVGIAALSEGGMYQLLFLVEHVGLLVIGVLLHRQWAVWWGVIGAVAAVLYFIKDFVYLWLALLGIGLIALVIWQLVRMSKKDS